MTPLLSVIVPCRDEGMRIVRLLEDLAFQEGVPGAWEIVVADASEDQESQRMLADFAGRPGLPFTLRIVANPHRGIPQGLNRAAAAARGTLVVRIDAHARIGRDYVAAMAAQLTRPEVDVCGGLVYWIPRGDGLAARVIAWCLNHPLGNGGTPGRNPQGQPRRVRHTPLSCWKRTVWERIGGYDESLLTNEDFDFDWRADAAGFKVWTFPGPVYQALARATLGDLWRQRWRYGFWKAQVARRHPTSLSVRQLAPALALVAGLAWLAASFVHPLPALALAGAGTAFLVLVLFLVLRARGHEHPARRLECPFAAAPAAWALAVAAFAIIQAVWAAGFWWGLIRPVRRPAP